MKTISIHTIDTDDIMVAATNGEAFAVENEAYLDVQVYIEDLSETQDNVYVYTAEDDEFEGFCQQLDFSADNLPSEVYVAGELLFAMF